MSNKAEVEVSYDVSNEFFRLWLDERMNYTCGVFDGTENFASDRRIDYMKTTDHWLARLRKNEKQIREKWGNQVFEAYDRYLSTCVRAFDEHYQSLAQWSLRRVD